ncbi:MAG: CBS domain-containing protein [Syntrophobacteraceae bacterium]|jgi:CBS domain-containing protein
MRDLKAANVMVSPVVTARVNTAAKDVALQLLSGMYSGMPVTDDEGRILGIITELDLLDAVAAGRDLARTPVEEIMAKNPITADVDTPISKVLAKMREAHILRIPISEGGKLVGMITRYDILKSQIDPALFVL